MNMWGTHRSWSKRTLSVSKDREERMLGAAEVIKSDQYDFILFQVKKLFQKYANYIITSSWPPVF